MKRELDVILEVVCNQYGCERGKIIRRTGEHGTFRESHARLMAYYLCNELIYPKPSLRDIGGAFNRDHTSVLYGVCKVETYPPGEKVFLKNLVLREFVKAGIWHQGMEAVSS